MGATDSRHGQAFDAARCPAVSVRAAEMATLSKEASTRKPASVPVRSLKGNDLHRQATETRGHRSWQRQQPASA